MYGRYGIFVSMVGAVVGLSLLAWRLTAVQDARETLPPLAGAAPAEIFAGAAYGESLVAQAQTAALHARLVQASTVANVYAAQVGSFEGLTTAALREIDPALDPSITIGWATTTEVCLEATSGEGTVHTLTSVGGLPAAGPC
jgi:hypothetical protein